MYLICINYIIHGGAKSLAPPSGNIFRAVYEWNNENVFLQNERFLGKVDFNQWFGHDKLTFNDSILAQIFIRPTPGRSVWGASH